MTPLEEVSGRSEPSKVAATAPVTLIWVSPET